MFGKFGGRGPGPKILDLEGVVALVLGPRPVISKKGVDLGAPKPLWGVLATHPLISRNPWVRERKRTGEQGDWYPCAHSTGSPTGLVTVRSEIQLYC